MSRTTTARLMPWAVSVLVLVCLTAYADGLAVMSVDLGSEFMKVAIVKPGVPMEIALNKESMRKTNVVVTMRNGERLFSSPAMGTAVKYPKMAYWYMQDLLGKRMDNPQVQLFQKRFPYYNMVEEEGVVYFKHDEETKYSVEELLAMILETAKEIATTFAEQPVSDVVITVPPYFNQAERRALIRAAELAGLKLLQLMNTDSAVALNFGIFRRKEFNSTASHYMFFDSGASSTTATIVAYQVVKQKSPTTGITDTFPQVTVKGVGYNRNLGGLEFSLRLRDHLAKLFNDQKKVKGDVRDNQRAMGKLMKEANRLKHVLSANAAHFAQIEGLIEDIDFRAKVTRDEFEAMCSDLFQDVGKVVADVLKSSEVTMEELTEVILMGANTRIPKIQEALQKAIGREELGKSINTDEAAALGAVYQAAHLSKGFKVKKFAVKEANLYPIQVEFEKVKAGENGEADTSKLVKRTLFGRNNPYPQKKVMTFNKHSKDFGFEVNYGDLAFMSEAERKVFGSTKVQEISLTGVEAAIAKQDEDVEPKGVKAHFRMDEGGILSLDKVESVFEKPPPADGEEDKEESTLSKIGSYLFGSSEEKNESKEGGVEEPEGEGTKSNETETGKTEKPEEKAPEKEAETDSKKEEKPQEAGGEQKEEKKTEEQKEEPKADEKKEETPKTEDKKEEPKENGKKTEDKNGNGKEEKKDGKTDDKKGDEKKEEEKKEKKPSKPTIIRENIDATASIVDMPEPSTDMTKESKKKLSALTETDKEKELLAKAQNDLESFIINTQDKLYSDAYEKCSTEDERTALQTQLSEASDWLYEQDESVLRHAYTEKLKELEDAVKSLKERIYEFEERPRALQALKDMLNYSDVFLAGMKNFTGEDQPFTEVEYSTLEKLINETTDWKKTTEEEIKKSDLTEKPKITVQDIATKLRDLDREVKYLVNKAKTYRPKPKPTEKKDDKKDTNKTKAESEEKTEDEKTEEKAEEQTEEGKEEGSEEGPQIDLPPPPGEEGEGKKEEKEEKEGGEKEAGEEETLQLDGADVPADSTTTEKSHNHEPEDEL